MPSAVCIYLEMFFLVLVEQMASTMLHVCKQTLLVAIFSAVPYLFVIFHYSSVELYQLSTSLSSFLLPCGLAGFARYKVLILYY